MALFYNYKQSRLPCNKETLYGRMKMDIFQMNDETRLSCILFQIYNIEKCNYRAVKHLNLVFIVDLACTEIMKMAK